ncbi:MAG: hypothetical protein HY073_05425 [Deltaproteobacteria bacterium]|nr:hypothetical protein [Deltaproteobacteria bacterium]
MEKQITLRGLPPRVFQELKREAKKKRKSLNQVLLDHLLPSTEQDKGDGACADLLKLSGTWDEKRARDFEAHFQGQRHIDPELWS